LSTKIFRQNASTKILSTKCFSTKVSLDERHRILFEKSSGRFDNPTQIIIKKEIIIARNLDSNILKLKHSISTLSIIMATLIQIYV
jgi:hypothetical protein